MNDPRDYKLEISSLSALEVSDAGGANPGRPFLSVHFACCSVYVRIYRSTDGKTYAGRCPKCAKPVTFAVGDAGTTARSFVVS